MSKNVLLPLSLFERLVELIDDLRDSSYEYCLCTKYGDLISGVEAKMQKLELREAYALIMSARGKPARAWARAEYLRKKSQIGMYAMTGCELLLKAYEAKIGDMTSQERDDLHKWVASGRSPYENPCLIYGENGRILDYITAIRIDEDMMRNPDDYFPAEDRLPLDDLDDLPF